MKDRRAGIAVAIAVLAASVVAVGAAASVGTEVSGDAATGVAVADRPAPIEDGVAVGHLQSSGPCHPRCEWDIEDIFFETPSNGTTIVVERATFDAPGFVVLTNESGDVIGVSGLQDIGDSRLLPIDLYRPLQHSQDITGTVWYDDGDGEFERGQDTRSNVTSTESIGIVDLNHNRRVSTSGYPATPAHEDVSGDGAVTVADVRVLFGNLETASHYPDRYDFDGDGEVTVADVVALFEAL